MVKPLRFGRAEKLKSRKLIDTLFASGSSLAAFPLRVKYQFTPAEEGASTMQAGVTVSKKHFKRAVDRNRIKRLMREAYRLQKAALMQTVKEKNINAALFFMYTDKSLPDFATVYQAMTQCLEALQKKAGTKNESTG